MNNYSVVIPTYQRPTNLGLILDQLARVVSSKTNVLILTEPNSDSLPSGSDYARWTDRLNIQVSVNTCKAGVDESILRAYEQCDSEWVYFLGDSKLPSNDFENVFQQARSSQPNAAAYFFSYDSLLSGDVTIKSIGELAESGLTLGDFILGGNSIFSRRIIDKYISHSYRTLSSRIAHVSMPLMALVKGEVIFLSRGRIISQFIEKPSTYQPGKALLDCWASFSLLSLLPVSYSEAVAINKYVVNSEQFFSRVNFFKYALLKIFREKIAISKDLKCILRLRYQFYVSHHECLMLRFLYCVARVSEVLGISKK